MRIEQTVELTTDAGHEEAARALVAKAEDGCLVTVSLDFAGADDRQIRTPVAGALAMDLRRWTARAWDRRYAGRELVWTSAANRFLVAETATLRSRAGARRRLR